MEGIHRPAGRPRRYDDFRLSDVPGGAPSFDGTDVPVQYVFDYLDEMHNIFAFLDDFPEVGLADAIRAIRVYVKSSIPVHSDRGRVSGMPVFRGSRVPVWYLFSQLAEGVTIDEFLEDFPTAGREQVVKALEMAGLLMEAIANENSVA